MSGDSHGRSVVVWDVPSAVGVGETFTIRLGIRCEGSCSPADWTLEVRDHSGATLACLRPDGEPWVGTEALYGVAVPLNAPETEGLYEWEAVAQAVAHDADEHSPGGLQHEEARAPFSVRTVPRADFRLQVVVVDRSSRSPVAGAKVVVHPFRAVTDSQGIAELGLPRGRYCLFVSGGHFIPLRIDGELLADTTLRAELEHDSGPSDAELWS